MGLLGLSDGSGWVCGSGGPSGFGGSGGSCGSWGYCGYCGSGGSCGPDEPALLGVSGWSAVPILAPSWYFMAILFIEKDL